MEISTRRLDNIIIFDIVGEIDIYNSTNIKELVAKKIEDGEKNIIINLQRVNYIDSSGIGTLISCNSILTKHKGTLLIENINDSIKKIFTLTQIDAILKVFLTEEEALNFFKNKK